jgi:hypothetical protein
MSMGTDGWIPHIPGDPMPCDRELMVDVKFEDGRIFSKSDGSKAKHWVWRKRSTPGLQIIAWRLNQSQPTPNYAPDDPKGHAGSLKAPMWLLPPSAMSETAWVHKHGADKYGSFNWREGGVCASTYVSAIMRHLDLWRDGEDLDAESKRSHLAHIAASCNILMDAAKSGTLRDDRRKLK